MRQLKIAKQITNRESYSLDKYLNEIGKVELLSPEEEVLLAKRIRNGDAHALDRLTKANLRFVVSVAKQYRNEGLTLNDLINEGNLGLIKAAHKFDESRGFKFISYAVWWIRQSIMQALVEQSRFVRLPLNRVATISKIVKKSNEMEQILEREPTPEELAEQLEIPTTHIDLALGFNTKLVSVNQPINADGEGNMLDVIADEDAPNPEKGLLLESLKRDIERILCTLTRREADVLTFYFGLNDNQPITLEEIADKFCLTKERVRQIRDKSLLRLRHILRGNPVKYHLG